MLALAIQYAPQLPWPKKQPLYRDLSKTMYHYHHSVSVSIDRQYIPPAIANVTEYTMLFKARGSCYSAICQPGFC